jgi:hypothetical protein
MGLDVPAEESKSFHGTSVSIHLLCYRLVPKLRFPEIDK